MMNHWLLLGIVLLVLLLLAALAAAWLVMKRPTWVYIQASRRRLLKARLRKALLPSPAGPQTVFRGGSGPVLVLLHGAGDQAGTWARVAPDLMKTHSLVIPDLAGHGDSAPGSGPIRAAAIVAGLEALLEGQSGPVTLVGNSLGAWMAMLLAHRHPDKVARVVAVNGGSMAGLDPSVNLLPRTREEARTTMARIRHPGNPAPPDLVLDDMVRRARFSPLARLVATEASMPAWVMDEAQLRALKLPVRLVWGEADQLMTLDYARRLQALLPDAELIPVARCGHIPQQEAPERFLAALERALTI